jgi:hypothetical protein
VSCSKINEGLLIPAIKKSQKRFTGEGDRPAASFKALPNRHLY